MPRSKREEGLGRFVREKDLDAREAALRKKESGAETERVKAALLKHSGRAKAAKNSWSLVELSRTLDAKVPDIEAAVEQLRSEGFDIQTTDGVVNRLYEAPRGALRSHVGRVFEGGWVRFGLLGDNQGGNRNERLDVLATAYDHYKREGIDTVYHGGNIVDGYHPRLNGFELLPEAGSTMESQARYITRVYPKVDGITTHFITGECHEGWWAKREGINVGRFLQDRMRLPLDCAEQVVVGTDKHGQAIYEAKCKGAIKGGTCTAHGRTDLSYIGHEEADIELRARSLKPGKRGPIMRVLHPGGGSSYAVSYTTQKLAEALQGGEKPQIQAVAHYHKFDYNFAREIHNVQTGCCSDQSLFMRKNKLPAHVGYLIVDANINPDGTIQRFRLEWVPFFDQGFYKKYATW